jgi:hypothetical protein
MNVRSSLSEMVFFMGLNLDTNTSMSPEHLATASSSVYPTYASGGCTKQAEGTCHTQGMLQRLIISDLHQVLSFNKDLDTVSHPKTRI